MRIQIPKRHRPAFARFIQYSDETADALFSALRQAQPALRIEDLASEIARNSGLPAEEVQELLSALAGLYLLLAERDVPVEAVVEAVAKGLETMDDPALKLEEHKIGAFKRRLATALSFDRSLGITSKALDVLRQQKRFCTARIVTDVRPVFYSDPSEVPAGVVVIHTLRIRYHEGVLGDPPKEFHIALDRTDMAGLSKAIERARKKEETLRSLLKDNGVLLLEAE